MKNLLTYLSTLALLISCTTKQTSIQEVKIPKEEFSFPKFISKEKISIETVTIYWLNEEMHYPLYFGMLTDTIELKRVFGHSNPPPTPEGNKEVIALKKGKFDDYFLDWMNLRDYRNWDSVKLNIQIDTSQFISVNGRKSHPVLIENLYSDTIYIGYGTEIPFITEALDARGNWKPIEKQFVYMCGNGLESIILPPKEFVITSVLAYTGEFKTKLRLQFGQNYSREFIGSINKTQFESEWDTNWNKKPIPTNLKQ